MKDRRRFIFFLVCVILCLESLAQERVPRKWRVSPLPVVFYSPETRLGFGALVSANRTFGDSTTTGSYFQSSFIYTLNKQYQISNLGRIYTNGNRHIIQYKLYYAYFPEFYFGYQTLSPEDYKELIDYRRLTVEFRKFWQLKRYFYAGMFVRYTKLFDVTRPLDGSLDTQTPPGYDGYSIFGIAPAFNFDSRDNQVYPRTGYYVETLFIPYAGVKSDLDFNNVRIDARGYRKVGWLKDDVIAVQMFFNMNYNTVPFREMADIGGAYTMRGYYTGYYRFKNLYAFQAEYRFMFSKLAGMAIWAGGAFVSEQWTTPFKNPLMPNVGVGFRLRINQKDKLNLRADYGVGRNQSGLYLDAAEAY
jgi:outer membrane protein assembly factor BamA